MTLELKTLTVDQIKAVMPKSVKKNVPAQLVQEINDLIGMDEEIRDTYRDNILGYIDVLKEGRFSIQDYVNACRFVTYKLMGNTNIVAYSKTFPDRFQRLIDTNTSDKDKAAHAAMYNKGKLVNLIFARTLVPTHVLNADLYQAAINAQANLMNTAKSEKVRCDAANSLLTHLKAPEASKIELDVTHKTDGGIEELKEITRELAQQQKALIEGGATNAKAIAESSIIKTIPAPD